MTEQKEIKDQKLEEKKLEKPVEENKEIVQTVEDKTEIDNTDEKVESSDHDKKGSPEVVTYTKKETKSETKKEENKEEKKPNVKKTETIKKGPKKKEAVVNGRDLRISTKHAVAVCDFIRNKDVDLAIGQLEEVSKMKIAIPMKGEIPHKKGMMSGRYPINAVKDFLRLLKSVKANAMVNELELEKVNIFCMANVASRPRKRFGQGKHKRSHVQIKLIPRGGK